MKKILTTLSMLLFAFALVSCANAASSPRNHHADTGDYGVC